jgi:hypothetical protein
MNDRFDTLRFFSLLILSLTAALVITMFLINAGSLPGWVVLTALGALIGTAMTNLAYQRPPGATLADLHSDAVSKRKNNATTDPDPMDLLTDDDIEDLRAELRESLRERIRRLSENGDNAEVATFEDLLERRKHNNRR